MWFIEAHSDRFHLTRDGVSLHIPCTSAGTRVLYQVLSIARAGDKIATPGFPTQEQLNQMVQDWKSANKTLTFTVDLTLSELGI